MASKGGHWKAGRFVRAKASSRTGGGSAGIYSALRSKLRRGLADSDVEYFRDPQSFRASSFNTVQTIYKDQMAKGMSPTRIAAKHMDPVRIHMESDGKIHVNDGRHRFAVAREMGAKAVRANVIQHGPRGGIVWQKQMVVRLR